MAQKTWSDLEKLSQLTQTHNDESSLDILDLYPFGIDFTTPSSWAVVKLPQFFLLKGDNGKYLASNNNGDATLIFTADDKMNATMFEAVPLSDGSINIRSAYDNRFWTFDEQSRNVVQAAQLGSDLTSRFWAVKMGRGSDSRLIGLRLFRTRVWVIHLRRSANNNTLFAPVGNTFELETSMGFEVEEAVSQRQIYGVTYHMEQAKLSEHEPLTSVTKDVKNWSKTPQKGVLSFTHTEKESHSWGSTDSWKISGSVSISVRIPFVGGTDISTEAYYSGAYEWGEEQETAKEIGTQLEVEVPAMSMVQATMIVQQGKLEVPFSYGQRDTLYNGHTSLANLPDGLFSSVNTYVTYETIKRSLA